MKEDNRIVPIHIVRLMIEYFSNDLLTEQERNDLDEWINTSDDNMKIFEEMVELVESRKESFWKYPDNPDRIFLRRLFEERTSFDTGEN